MKWTRESVTGEQQKSRKAQVHPIAGCEGDMIKPLGVLIP